MTNKPGLFGRLKQAISSTLNDAVEAVSDPGQEIALMLDDLADQVKKSELDLKQAIVDQKMMERKLEQMRKDEAAWQARAEQALHLNDDTLARAALQRKTEISSEVVATDEAVVQQRKLVEDLRAGINASKAKLKALNLRRGSLMAQAAALVEEGSWAIDGPVRRGLDAGPDVSRDPRTGSLYPNKPPGATVVAAAGYVAAGVGQEAVTLRRATWFGRLLAGVVPVLVLCAWLRRRLLPGQAGTLALATLALATPLAAYAHLLYGHALTACVLWIGAVMVVDGIR
jgi:hypothetical protein